MLNTTGSINMAGWGLSRLFLKSERRKNKKNLFLLQVHHCGGARLERVGLPVGLHLLSVRRPQRLRSGHHALQRPGRCGPSWPRPRDPLAEDTHSIGFLLISGINIFLDGYVPTENLRFRETSLVFKVAETANEEEVKRLRHYQVGPHPQRSSCFPRLLERSLSSERICWGSCFCPGTVSRNEEDDGRVHTGDQKWRVHGLWDHGDAGRKRWEFDHLPKLLVTGHSLVWLSLIKFPAITFFSTSKFELFSFLFPGTGKTTFIRMLAGGLKSDGGGECCVLSARRWTACTTWSTRWHTVSLAGEVPILNVSYKPQTISPKFKVRLLGSFQSNGEFLTLTHTEPKHLPLKFSHRFWKKVPLWFVQGSVRALLHEKIRDAYTHPQFITDVMKPMQIESIIDQDVREEPSPRSLLTWEPQLWLKDSPTSPVSRCRTCLVVSCRESPSPCVWANQPTSTWSMSPRPTWTPSRGWWPPGSSRGALPSPSLAPLLTHCSGAVQRGQHPCFVARAQVHPPCEEDGVCGGARFHHGDVPGRQSHRVWRHSLQEHLSKHVRASGKLSESRCPLNVGSMTRNFSPQSAESAGWDEPLPVAAGDHVQKGPKQFQAPN